MGSERRAGRSICVWAASGGHGGTTIAGAVAAILGASIWSHDEDAYRWIWGQPRAPSERLDITVHDAGVVGGPLVEGKTNAVVLRGPCSSAIRQLVPHSNAIHHLILLSEPWRPLRRQDVEDALGVGVGAEVPFSPRVARLADAGLLSARIADLPEFNDLRRWTEDRIGLPGVRDVRRPSS